ncbi:MAG: hypothetical protein VKK04_16015 [Synechococcales bacterium]|nr:hypothetical protein [Synechococcales bacterium]
MKRFSVVRTWVTNALFSVVAIALIWQSFPFLNTVAIAAPTPLLAANTSAQAHDAANDVRAGSKNLIQETKDKVERAANSNASKVDRADDSGSFVERKARRDQARIHQRAEEDAARTERAVDKSTNAFKDAVDNIKDAFSN